jgi:hypothetical protein
VFEEYRTRRVGTRGLQDEGDGAGCRPRATRRRSGSLSIELWLFPNEQGRRLDIQRSMWSRPVRRVSTTLARGSWAWHVRECRGKSRASVQDEIAAEVGGDIEVLARVDRGFTLLEATAGVNLEGQLALNHLDGFLASARG